jgi:hypothetical protein
MAIIPIREGNIWSTRRPIIMLFLKVHEEMPEVLNGDALVVIIFVC